VPKKKDFRAEFDTAALLQQGRALVDKAKTEEERRVAVQAVAAQVLELQDTLIDRWEQLPAAVRSSNPQLEMDLERWIDRVGVYAPPDLQFPWPGARAAQAGLLYGRQQLIAVAKEDDQQLLLENPAIGTKKWPTGRPDLALGWSLANQLNAAATVGGWNTREAFGAVLSNVMGAGEAVVNAASDGGLISGDAAGGMLGLLADGRLNPDKFLNLLQQGRSFLRLLLIGAAVYLGFTYGPEWINGE